MRLPTFFLLVGCAGPKAPPSAEPADSGSTAAGRACNRHAALCDRPVSTVTFPGTHNSMSNAEAGWIAPNQQYGLTRQLEDGIRGLMLDTYQWEGDLWLCHATCELGALPLADGLAEIRDFLDAHPREVIQVVFQQGEKDTLLETTQADYVATFRRMYDAVVDRIGQTPWLLCQSSYRMGVVSPAVIAAQVELADTIPDISAGPNLDRLGSDFRRDDTHFNDAGLEAYAADLARLLSF